MKYLPVLLVCLLLMGTLPAHAVFVKINALTDSTHNLTPPNPVTIAGKVISESPLKISDGGGEIAINGMAARLGDFLLVTGDWNGSNLTQTTFDSMSPLIAYIGPASTEMIYIPAGSFLMGNSGVGDDGLFYASDELPQHSVTLAEYYIGKYEVTRGEYAEFIRAGGYSNPAYWSPAGWIWKGSRTQPSYWDESQDFGTGSFTQTDSDPAVGITYFEGEAYCNWAGGRLPTEAEWEKAARWTGSHPNVYPWGDVWDPQKCNNYYDSNPAGGGQYKFQTSPVGSYLAGGSPYGCRDMAGNVYEWCQDWYRSYPGSGSPFDDTDSVRVMRGGSWYYNIAAFRCASRYGREPSSTGWPAGMGLGLGFGFRMARSGS